MTVRMPRVFDKNLNEARRIKVIDVSISLSMIPVSTASITAPIEEAAPVGTYIELYTIAGSAGVFKVRSLETDYSSGIASMDLEHAITEVGDYIYKGEYTQETGLNTAISEIFSGYGGTHWTIGTNPYGTRVVADISYENVLQAILSLMEQTPDCMMAFDFTQKPWRINIVKKDTTVTAEGRISRNIESATVTYDDSELCTRAYVDWEDGNSSGTAHYDADTISTYGVVEKLVPSAGYTPSQAETVARKYLAKHKRPNATISISGFDFSRITGEQLDRIALGKLYRLALPKYSTVIEEHITTIDYPGVYTTPDKVEIGLGGEPDPVVAYIKTQEEATAAVARGGKKTTIKQGEYFTRFDRTETYLDLVAGKTTEAGTILQQAGLYIDANGVLQYADDNVNNISSKLKVTANQIRSEVNSTKEGLMSEINQTKEQISLKVSKGDVATQLSVEAGNVRVRGGNLIVEGMVTADAVKSAIADISDLTVGGAIRATNYYLGTGAIPVSMGAGVYDIRITQSGNNYTLQKQTFDNSSWVDVRTFSRAVASMNGVWGSGVLRVTPQPQGSPVYKSILSTGTKSLSGKTYTVPIKAAHGDNGEYSDGQVWSVTVNADEVYDNGYDDGYEVTQSQVSGSNAYTIPTSAGSSVVSGKRSVGSCARPTVASYLIFTLSIHGDSHDYYITLN